MRCPFRDTYHMFWGEEYFCFLSSRVLIGPQPRHWHVSQDKRWLGDPVSPITTSGGHGKLKFVWRELELDRLTSRHKLEAQFILYGILFFIPLVFVMTFGILVDRIMSWWLQPH